MLTIKIYIAEVIEIDEVEYLLLPVACSFQDEAYSISIQKRLLSNGYTMLNASLLAMPALYCWSIKSFGARHACP